MLTPSSIAADLMHAPRHPAGAGARQPRRRPCAARCGHRDGVHRRDRGADEVDSVFVGWHPQCGMKDIEAACQAIWGGAKLYVASDVPFFATKQGRTIGYSFAITAAIRRLTRAPMILTGKPSVRALRFVARRLGRAGAEAGGGRR